MLLLPNKYLKSVFKQGFPQQDPPQRPAATSVAMDDPSPQQPDISRGQYSFLQPTRRNLSSNQDIGFNPTFMQSKPSQLRDWPQTNTNTSGAFQGINAGFSGLGFGGQQGSNMGSMKTMDGSVGGPRMNSFASGLQMPSYMSQVCKLSCLVF